MSGAESLTLSKVREAILYAAKNYKDSVDCELEFAEKVRLFPQVLQARLRRSQYVVEQLNVNRNCVLADLGSGNGLNSVLVMMCGARQVYAIEYEEQRFKTSEFIVNFLGLTDKVHLCRADLLEFNLPRGSIDGAYSSELLEHIADLPKLYRKVGVWLKSLGKVYARTGANGRNFLKRRFFRQEWEKCDRGYQKQRKEIIRLKVPHLSAEQISILVDRTRGLLSREVEMEVERFIKTGKFPIDKRPCPPRDPYTGEYMERALDAFEIAKLIDKENFTTRVMKPDFSSLTIVNPLKRQTCWFLGQIIKHTHPLSLCVAPWLEFLSTKNV